MYKKLLILALISGLSSLSADVVHTIDGARLPGTITGIRDGTLSLETTFAGTLSIDLDQVKSFSSDSPLSVRLQSGNTMSGVVRSGADTGIRINNEDGTLSTSVDKIAGAWAPGEQDPAITAREEELESQRRKWSYSVSSNLGGSGGNSDELKLGFRADAKLEGPDDTLLFYGRYKMSETNGVTTEDETVGGMRFDAFPFDRYGWYARTEVENDPFENLDLRTTVAGGFNYRFINRDNHSLVGRLGGAYRYQSFTNGTDSEEPALDLGLTHEFAGAKYWKLNSELSVNPSLENMDEFLATHSTILEIPLPDKFWSLGVGITNDYNSEPPVGIDEWDYTWFASLILNWN